jgi:glycosyltransferase involved in cell wall biosynthesis
MSAPSGPGTHIREIINGFEEQGHEVVKLIAGGEKLESGVAPINIKKRSWKKWIPTYVWESLKDYSLLRLDKKLELQLEALIAREKPDFIYERAYYMMGAGYRVAKRLNIRYGCEINAPYPEEKTAMSGRSIFTTRAIANERDQIEHSYKVFTVSSALKSYLEKAIGKSSEHIIITPNAVNPKYILENEKEEEKLRKKLGLSNDEKVIGFVGSIFKYHGVDALIEAFAEILQNRSLTVKLLIVGDGEILPDLKRRVAELKIEHLVHFTGNVPHKSVYHYIGLMDIAVMARSNWYGSPVKIFEYGIMGKCIIAPNVVPVCDVMEHQQDGILIADELAELKNALTFLLENPAAAERMARSFQQKVSTKHTWQQVSAQILSEVL